MSRKPETSAETMARRERDRKRAIRESKMPRAKREAIVAKRLHRQCLQMVAEQSAEVSAKHGYPPLTRAQLTRACPPVKQFLKNLKAARY